MVSPQCQQNADNSRCEDWHSGFPEKFNKQAHKILVLRPNKNNKCVSGNWSENLRLFSLKKIYWKFF